MTTIARLEVDVDAFRRDFDRQPLQYSHNLSSLELFRFESLLELAERYAPHSRDYFVSASAPSPGTQFFGVPHGLGTPREAMESLEARPVRVLLKRPENHDPRFRELLNELFDQVMRLRGGLRRERLVRLESSVFVTSAASTTPFHFDPEIAFFSQIEGDKIYHVFSPQSVQEAELEKFYLQGQVSIGQLDLASCDPVHETVFQLNAGRGFHQPQNSPHWVQTAASRSISYSFVFETDLSRARGHARAYNYYLRKMGVDPRVPGVSVLSDAAKAGTMQAVIPVRRGVGRLLKKLRSA